MPFSEGDGCNSNAFNKMPKHSMGKKITFNRIWVKEMKVEGENQKITLNWFSESQDVI